MNSTSIVTYSPAPTERFVTEIRQVCLVTDDFEGTLRELTARFGLGPFKCWYLRAPKLFGRTLRGKAVPWTIKLAIAWVGRMQLEVIQPVNGPSMLQEYASRQSGGGGIHHLLVATGNAKLARAIERFRGMGCQVVQEGFANLPAQVGPVTVPPIPRFAARRLSTHFAYIGTEDIAGTVLEVSQLPPLMPFRLGMELAKADYKMPGASPAGSGLVKEIVKVGIVTRDLDRAVERYVHRLGAGPWRMSVLDASLVEGATFRGQPAAYKARVAQGLVGETIVEIVQPLEGASLYSEWLERDGEGVHYLGVTAKGAGWTETRDSFARAGCPTLMEGEWQGMYCFAYLDTAPFIKTTLEISSYSVPIKSDKRATKDNT